MKKLASLLVLLALTACATYVGPMRYGSIQAVQDFQAGAVRLDCETQCAPDWSANLDRLSALYDSGQWQPLAEAAMRIDYACDLAYFFLGAAAEGMGYPEAAFTYYQLSAELSHDAVASHHCRDSVQGCGGVDLSVLLPQRLAALGKTQPSPVPLTDAERSELRNILYVQHSVEICSRPLSPIVKDEMAAYLDYYKQRLQYDAFNAEDAAAVKDIKRRGKKICSSAREKKRFDEAVSRILPFDKAHPDVAASMAAQPPQGVPSGTEGAVTVPYTYYAGFWWGAVWFPAGYYDPYWRYYGLYPGPGYVMPPGYSWHHPYPGYWGRPYPYHGPGWYGGPYRGHRW